MENRVNPTAAVKTGWSLTKEHLIVSLGLILGYCVVNMLMGFLPAEGIMSLVSSLLTLAISSAWTLGMTRITICAVDGEEPQFSMFGEAMHRFGSMVLLMLALFGIMMVPIIVILIIALILGFNVDALEGIVSSNPYEMMEAMQSMGMLFLLIMIPCIYLGIRFIFAPYVLVDRGLGVIDSIKASWTASAPIQGRILVFMLLIFLAYIIGFVCFFVGLFISTITALYAQAAFYRQVFPSGIQDPLMVEDANVVMN